MSTPIDTPEVQKLVKKYVAVRALKKAIKADMDAKIALCDQKLDEVETQLNAEMTRQGAESIKTQFGTCYFSKRYKASAEDWPAIEAYILESGRVDLLERRVSSTVVKDIVDATGELPPGITAEVVRGVNVRQS